MKLNPDELLKVIGKQTVMIELLQSQLKEAHASEPERNGSGTTSERAAWAQATAPSQTPEVR
jgi:adenylosuccinate lyase